MIRTLVVDDTILYRTLVSEALQRVPEVRIVGTAADGRTALSKILTLKPDLVTLDIEMPEMNGIEVLDGLRGKGLDTAVVVVSSLTERGGALTMDALERGAFDFITKPQNLAGRADFDRVLQVIVSALVKRLEVVSLLRGSSKPRTAPIVEPKVAAKENVVKPRTVFDNDVIVVGISTGGPNALLQILPEFPGDLKVPVVVVQHMPPIFTANLAQSLSSRCRVPVKEAENGEVLAPGTIYIAPGGKQTKIVLGSDAKTKLLRVTDDPPENGCHPSADYLFRSAAHLYFGKATAVIMTGMGSDGLKGIEALKKAQAHVIAQDEASCVVYGMPKAVVDAGLADEILPLTRIPQAIMRTVK